MRKTTPYIYLSFRLAVRERALQFSYPENLDLSRAPILLDPKRKHLIIYGNIPIPLLNIKILHLSRLVPNVRRYRVWFATEA